MDISKLIPIVVTALLFGGIFWLIGKRRASTMIDVGRANTEAVRENTAAVRELIAKLDQAKQ